MGTESEAAPDMEATENFSPMLDKAPPPFGSVTGGTDGRGEASEFDADGGGGFSPGWDGGIL
jgi:hypothetical protein